MISTLVNHLVFVIDRSSSIKDRGLEKKIVSVFDSQIKHAIVRAKELDQETRVSVYLFGSKVECLAYDMDVLRMPSLEKYYRTGGMTALVDGAILAIDDLGKTPQIYGDHAFLIYLLTDGEENASANNPCVLSERIKRFPDNWTLAAFVPNQSGVHEAKKCGIPAENISVWDISSAGLEKAGSTMSAATDRYMTARSTGTRGTKTLFTLDSSGLTKDNIARNLDSLGADKYLVLSVSNDDRVIKEFVESWTRKAYVPGSSYYQLTKPETIQPYKQVCIRERATGKVFSGPSARDMIGLPQSTVKISPLAFSKYEIFLQSTSLNRKLVKDTLVIVLT